MSRKSHAALILTMAIVGGIALPAVASTPVLSFADVNQAPRATITGSTASVTNVTSLKPAAEATFDVVREGWFACDQAITNSFTGPTISALLFSTVPALTGITFRPPQETSGNWKCLSLNNVTNSIDLSTATIWNEVSDFDAYSTKAAQYPHIAYLGAYVKKSEFPTLTNMRLVTPQTREYTPPPTPGPTSPTWNSNLVNGGVPQLSISGTLATVISNPGPVRTGGLGIGFARIYACNQPVTAGFYSWAAPVGQPIYPPAGAVGGANCVEIGTGTTGFTIDLNSPGTQANDATRYNPQTHGVHITVGWRDPDNFKTPGGGSPANQDDLMWLSLGGSVQYSPPASPTAVLPVFTIVNDSITFTTPPSWTGADANSEEYFVFACHPTITADATPRTPFSPTPGGCVGLFTANSTLGNLVPATLLSNAQALVAGSLVAYNPSAHGRNIAIQSAAKYAAAPFRVSTASQNWLGSVGGGSQQDSGAQNTADVVRPAPFAGPVLNTPAITSSVAAGGKVVIPGSNLAGVSSVEIGGVRATVVVNSAGELEITIPADLAAGTYDLVVVSSSGRLTVQNAITVSGSSEGNGSATPSTKRMDDDSAKVWVFDVVGAGKVQIFVNGKEIAWVNTTDANNSKLTNGYLVRTVELKAGKNIIEVFVDGERERRTVYSN